MRRFFLDRPLSQSVIISGNDAHHIVRVLRMQVGDTIEVVDSDGKAGMARISGYDSENIVLDIVEVIEENREPAINVCLAQALLKGDKMDLVVQKAVELGVNKIAPIVTDYCVVSYDNNKQALRVSRWQKIAREAAKQCGRNVVPQIMPVQRLEHLLPKAEPDSAIILLYEAQTPEGLKEVITSCRSRNYLLIIGPEGGFSSEEVKYCRQAGARIATMGPRILRAETAALAALTAVMYQCADLGGCIKDNTVSEV